MRQHRPRGRLRIFTNWKKNECHMWLSWHFDLVLLARSHSPEAKFGFYDSSPEEEEKEAEKKWLSSCFSAICDIQLLDGCNKRNALLSLLCNKEHQSESIKESKQGFSPPWHVPPSEASGRGGRGCGSGFVTLCNMPNWILMNCMRGMMLHVTTLVPLFRLHDKADVGLDCAALARTPCDPSCRQGNQHVTATRH